MSGYIAPQQSWSEEAKRLGSLESALDRATTRYLGQLGLAPGMRCLEVGAGSGSIARFLAERVGPQGAVVATDLDTTLLTPVATALPQLTLRSEDIASALPRRDGEARFDLAHARLVLGHVRERERALLHIVEAVRPGGWVLIEDADFLWTELGAQPLVPDALEPDYFRVWSVVASFMRERGYDVHWGRRLPSALAGAGLTQIGGEAVISIGDAALQRAMRLTIERFAAQLVPEGRLRAADVDACLRVMDRSDLVFTGSPVFSVWGRRPA